MNNAQKGLQTMSAFKFVPLQCMGNDVYFLESTDSEVEQCVIRKNTSYDPSEDTKQTRTKHQYQEEMLSAKRNSKNRDAAQQSFLIGLAAMFGYEIEVNKLYKKGKTTSQLFIVNWIKKDASYTFKSYDVVPEVNDLRDKRRCLDSVTISRLIDIVAARPGMIITEKKCRLSKYGHEIGMRRIKSLTYRGVHYSISDISRIGNTVHEYIMEHMGVKNCHISIAASPEITNCFKNIFEHTDDTVVL